MRFFQGMGREEAELTRAAKLTLFNFGSIDDIGRLAGARGVAGFFIPRAGGSVAFTPVEDESRSARNRSMNRIQRDTESFSDIVLLHEYAHYFMYQHAAAAYPMWYSEGFAEVYGTLVLREDGFRIGEPATHRGAVLDYLGGYHISRLLDPPPIEDWDGRDGAQIYALGYLLAHYLTFSDERPGQLGDYLTRLNQGETPLEAAENAFGDLDELDREMDRYRLRSRLPVRDVTFSDYTPPEVSVRRLEEDEAAQIMLHIRSQRGVDEDEAAALVPEARRLVERFPTSKRVLLSATEAEFDAKNFAEAEDLANRVLELHGEEPAAYIFLARIAMERGEKDPAQFTVAREHWATANRLEADNPAVMFGYYQSFVEAGETPPDSAVAALDYAQVLAGFDNEIRLALARHSVLQGELAFAADLLAPLANNPHGGEENGMLRETIALLDGEDRDGGLSKLDEAIAEIEKEDDEEEG